MWVVLFCLPFLLFPQLDLYFSSLFYQNGFYLKDTFFAKAIYSLTSLSIAVFGIGVLGLLLFNYFKRKQLSKELLYLLIVLILGPGLIVNTLFKDHWGRARPSQIVQFGGEKSFSTAGVIVQECNKNCSFPSGHAAAGFYFFALAFLLRGVKRKIAFWIALLWGSLVGFVRVVQGGHFLSDVVCSGVIVYLVSLGVYYLMFERK